MLTSGFYHPSFHSSCPWTSSNSWKLFSLVVRWKFLKDVTMPPSKGCYTLLFSHYMNTDLVMLPLDFGWSHTTPYPLGFSAPLILSPLGISCLTLVSNPCLHAYSWLSLNLMVSLPVFTFPLTFKFLTTISSSLHSFLSSLSLSPIAFTPIFFLPWHVFRYSCPETQRNKKWGVWKYVKMKRIRLFSTSKLVFCTWILHLFP